MPSTEFEAIFENARQIVQIRLANMAGVDRASESILKRVRNRKSDDPRIDRELFWDPWIDAQQLGIPRETAETIGTEYLQLTIFHLWTRVICPAVEEGEDGTIVETDSAEKLADALSEMCPICGGFHILSETVTETIYAPNLGSDERSALKPSAIRARANFAADPYENINVVRCHEISGLDLESPSALLIHSLTLNSVLSRAAMPVAIWGNVWKWVFVATIAFVVLMAIALVLVAQYQGYLLVQFMVSVLAIVALLAVIITVLCVGKRRNEILAETRPQRMVINSGFITGHTMIAGGVCGIECSFGDGVTRIPVGNKEYWEVPIQFRIGDANYGIAVLGLCLIALTYAAVICMDYVRGWIRLKPQSNSVDLGEK